MDDGPGGGRHGRGMTIDRVTLTRRGALGAALAVAASVPLASRASAADAPPRLTLPPPTGPFPVGTTVRPLVRGDRVLMTSLWYPARDAGRYPRAPWLAPAVVRELLVSAGFPPDAVLGPLTAGRLGAPGRRGGERLPVVVYSHGAHDHRAGNTVVVQELASHGYLVVTVDHTGDAFTQLPDGRVLTPDPEVPMYPDDFAADIRFVLDHLGELTAGRHDPHRIGLFGWSKGATAITHVMFAERRVRAGLSLDGPMEPEVPDVLDRPLMLMTAEFTRAAYPSVATLWSHLHGWRRNVQVTGAEHSSYTDYQVLLPQMGQPVGILDPARAVRIQQAYPLAFFDRHLRGRPARLLDGPSPAFPEVAFIP